MSRGGERHHLGYGDTPLTAAWKGDVKLLSRGTGAISTTPIADHHETAWTDAEPADPQMIDGLYEGAKSLQMSELSDADMAEMPQNAGYLEGD